MKSICKVLAGAALLFSAAVVGAQEKHTLYYTNGQKALEGRWTYTVGAFQRTNLVEAALYNMERSGDREDGPAESRSSFDYSGGLRLYSMGIRCEGPVTAYYQNGSKRSEVVYKKGVATGACTTYYKNGNKAWEGKLSNGVRTGDWKGYYESGEVYCKGDFEPFSQEQLQEFWQQVVSEKRYSRMENRGFREDQFEHSYSDTARATEEVRGKLKSFEAQVFSMQDGHVLFYQKNGNQLADITVKNGRRDGSWRLWQQGRKNADIVLEYRAGKLIAITEQDNRQMLGEYTAAYQQKQRLQQEEAERRRQSYDYNAVEPGLIQAEPVAPAYTYNNRTARNIKRATTDNRQPIFPGPGSLDEWVRKHIRYPATALRDSVYGYAYVTLLLSTEGKMTDAFIQTSSGHPGLDAEALRVVKSLPDFHPATSNGKKMRSSVNVMVNFQYPVKEEIIPAGVEMRYGTTDVGPMMITEMPPAGPDGIISNFDSPASFTNLSGYLSNNLRYPEEDRKAGNMGKVFVQFVVNLDGSLQDVKVAKSSGHPRLDAEALRLIRSMPKWTPAQKAGRNVRSIFKQAVTFHID